MSELLINEIQNIDDAIDIAFVRNTGASFMTGNDKLIYPDQQIAWYNEDYLPAREFNRIIAFVGHVVDYPVAYGLISQRDEDYWVTGVIDSKHRGYGYGEELFTYLSGYVLDNLADRVMLDVQPNNLRAYELYTKLGYVALFNEPDRIVMVLDREAWHEPQPSNF